ncbi:efflux RND transporter periplasmic adaptor subunit [Neiella marina]|uniref:Efflux RND transporter periplasmic adaptor subunit n=1 Tax=Neiella holothuriorum TaxID=2870530 RepID=A0ABS7EH41_9GAMM|nr:efflux RND transporter periplasmic adaptor subunit [Neiella holothuriorum]MBW8191656.1 efflux RND transporter periplasmic adaptor subunit [Neiella holothuriorum]
MKLTKLITRFALFASILVINTPAFADNMPTQNQQFSAEPFHIEISRTGRIDFRYVTNLSFKTSGFVDVLYADAGQRVYAGDSVAIIEMTDLLAAKASALASNEKADQDLVRAEKLYREKTVSEDYLEQAQTTAVQTKSELNRIEYDLDKAQIVVPFDGVVVERLVQPGEQVSSGAPVFAIASVDPKNLIIRLNLTQHEIAHVQRKMPAVVTLPDLKTFNAHIIAISAVADAQTGLYELELAADLGAHKALPGQWVTVDIGVESSLKSFRIPMIALAGITNGQASFVIANGDQYQLKQFDILHMDQQFIYVPAQGTSINIVTRGWNRLLNQLEQ